VDPVSQGALGAALAASAAKRPRVLVAGALGALAGMAPDLDVLIQSPTDPLLFLEYHRQFTHALVFVPLGALLCAVPLHLFARRWLAFGQTYLYCLLGYATHGLLDACTSYGTQLLWPFSEARIAWNFIAVVDPLFTIPLLALVIAAVVRRRPALAHLGMVWAFAYLGLGAWQHSRALDAAMVMANERGHEPESLSVKPSFGNLLVWKTLYADDRWFYVDAVRLGTSVTWFPGERARRLDPQRDLPWLDRNSQQAIDIERFHRFSAGYLAVGDHQPGTWNPVRIGDIRYSMVPNEIDPLWGIRVKPGAPAHRHVDFFMQRRASPRHREALQRMIFEAGDEQDRNGG
jgi:inner membrane protein